MPIMASLAAPQLHPLTSATYTPSSRVYLLISNMALESLNVCEPHLIEQLRLDIRTSYKILNFEPALEPSLVLHAAHDTFC